MLVYVCSHLSVNLYVYRIYACVPVCVYTVFVCFCMFICMFICVRLFTYVYMCICVYMYVYVCVCVCVCVCVRVCVCVDYDLPDLTPTYRIDRQIYCFLIASLSL